MGLSNFPSPGDGGVLPVLVMNTVISVTLVKNILRSALHLMGVAVGGGGGGGDSPPEIAVDEEHSCVDEHLWRRRRRVVSVTRFGALSAAGGTCDTGGGSSSGAAEECSVCLCGFKDEEDVSRLVCQHFFHKNCLEKWFLSRRSTCPLCRSLL